MVFPKKSRWNMIFLVLSGKTIFLFPENMILHLRRKMNANLSQKRYTEIWYFLQTFWKDGLLEQGHAGTWPFLYHLERWYFFYRKHFFFSLGRKWEVTFLKKYMEIWYLLCTLRVLQTWRHAPLSKRKSKMVLSHRYTPKGDWRSRLTT